MLPYSYGEIGPIEDCVPGLYYTPADGCTLMHFRYNNDGTFTVGRLQRDGSFRVAHQMTYNQVKNLGDLREVHMKSNDEIKRYQEAHRVLSNLPNEVPSGVSRYSFDKENNLVKTSDDIYESIKRNVAKHVKKAILEYNGSDAIADAEDSGYKADSAEYNDIIAKGRGSKFYKRNDIPEAGEISSFEISELIFDKCFMMFEPDSNSIIAFGYNNLADLCYLYGIEGTDEFYNSLDDIEIGESATDPVNNAIFTRIK